MGFTSLSPGDTGTKSTLSSWAVWVRRASELEVKMSSHAAVTWRHWGTRHLHTCHLENKHRGWLKWDDSPQRWCPSLFHRQWNPAGQAKRYRIKTKLSDGESVYLWWWFFFFFFVEMGQTHWKSILFPLRSKVKTNNIQSGRCRAHMHGGNS